MPRKTASSFDGPVRNKGEGTVSYFRCSDEAAATFDQRLFDAQWLVDNQKLVATLEEGRGKVRFISHRNWQLVLKTYRRGGLPARVNKDHYLWTGLQGTRCWREFDLLIKLDELGLPAPKPYAVWVDRRALWYRAKMLTVLISDAQSLKSRLADTSLDIKAWQLLGKTLRAFHDASVFHADLNASNILQDQQGHWYLIDFDRGRIRGSGSQHWKMDNLDRLRHSLQKLKKAGQIQAFDQSHWQWLTEAYADGVTAESGKVRARKFRP